MNQPERQEDVKTQPLPDLPLSDKQAEETAGGTRFLSFPGYNGGVFVGGD